LISPPWMLLRQISIVIFEECDIVGLRSFSDRFSFDHYIHFWRFSKSAFISSFRSTIEVRLISFNYLNIRMHFCCRSRLNYSFGCCSCWLFSSTPSLSVCSFSIFQSLRRWDILISKKLLFLIDFSKMFLSVDI